MTAIQSRLNMLEEPWEQDELLEVRTGKAQAVFGLPQQSAIFKSVRSGPVAVNEFGCQGDEHVFELHGGPDKALLHYCALHYDDWTEELPGSAHCFRTGAFGENLVSRRANERNTCIGDRIAIGSEVIVQVSLPRQPCYKLNHRFQEKNMARLSQESFRTGWFYRILRGGSIQAGDGLSLLERPNPKWTIARVQHYLYLEKENFEVMRELADLPELGNEIKTLLKNRLQLKFENQEQRLVGDGASVVDMWANYRLVHKSRETSSVMSLEFEAVEAKFPDELVQPGTHVRVKLQDRLIRAYSVVSGNRNKFTLGVALDPFSRGGSLFIHDDLLEGTIISISNFATTFPLKKKADRHVLIAGGIGITGLIASAQELHKRNRPYHLHYAVRSLEEVPFEPLLRLLEPHITIYCKSQNNPLDLHTIIRQADSNTHIYCCAGDRLTQDVQDTAKRFGLPDENVHFESFIAQSTGDPFTAELVESKRELEVPAKASLLNILRSAGFDIPSSCEAGNCGTCRVGVHAGRVEHRGTGLLPSEKETAMLSCVSRGIGRIQLNL
ncbi:Uncharacterized protein PECH_007414 [Penicillium ucsense]|uniref:MOSC domain-containing protein n=1 Tax=Penicillium ucsense TaxID=2839758 RepID=A0A8J8WB62_9EURO|nr:Uncharacterized protein PECM_000080 [Penicillium ucsense]KAF7734873.1 Uncharacterized protein PECH_007414 [Penicillium ucsense]